MTEDTMTEPRLLQVFLSKQGVRITSVSIRVDTLQLLCDCPGFATRRRCKHVDFVSKKVSPEGEYTVELTEVPVDALAEARENPVAWRAFVCRYVTPEVI